MPFSTERGPDGRPLPPRDDRPMPGERYAEKRSWLSRAADELASWAGDPDASRRRQLDQAAGDHRGHGPMTYQDEDQRILADVARRFAESHALDARNVIVTVERRMVRLEGRVAILADRRLAEDIAASIAGVVSVKNNLQVGEDL